MGISYAKEDSYTNCEIVGEDDRPIAKTLVVDLRLHRKAYTEPESTYLWQGLIRTTETVSVAAGDVVTLKIPGLTHRSIEILDPQGENNDYSIRFRGMGKVPVEIGKEED